MLTRMRTKLAVLMLLIALVPLLVTAFFDLRAMRDLGRELADQGAQALVDHTREHLRLLADDYARLIRREQQLIEVLLRRQAESIERSLEETPNPEFRAVFGDRFAIGDPELELRETDRYQRVEADGTLAPLSISYRFPAFHRAPGSDAAVARAAAARLAAMQPLLLEMQQQYGDLLYWQYAALDNGLHLSYPGHGAFPEDFDPRTRVWYLGQRDRAELTWSAPVTDASSRQLTVGVTLPLHDPGGAFIGVTGIDVRLSEVLRTLRLPNHLASASTILLAALREESGTGRLTGHVIARQNEAPGGGDWRQPVTMELIAGEDDTRTDTIVRQLQRERNGILRLPYRGEDAFWVFRALDVTDDFLILIVPVAATTQPARAATEYALRTTSQRINTMLPLVLGVVLVAIAIAISSARAVTTPVKHLSAAVERIAHGDFEARVEIATGDELQRLGEAFNRMVPSLKEHTQIRGALEIAREVQQNLLPASAPDIPGLDIAGYNAYCDETGGDYYDWLDLRAVRPGMVAVLIGDVAGHGVPSALLMTTVRALVHGFAAQCESPREVFTRINAHLLDTAHGGRYVTLFYLAFNIEQRTLSWASAGHDPAIRYRRDTDEFENLAGSDIPLGVTDWQYAEAAHGLWQSGDLFVLATDGVWETRNEAGELFGKERLRSVIRTHAAQDAGTISDRIVVALNEFRRTAVQRDDITLVVVKVG